MNWDLHPDTSLTFLFKEFREAMVSQVGDGTVDMYATHCRHLERHFKGPDSITQAGIADYCRARLGKVRRKTLQKECSTLRSFLGWCKERSYISKPPEVPSLPKRATGTASQPPRKVTPLTPEQARALIARLPKWTSPRGLKDAFPVQARFDVAFDTALRPATLDGLSVPQHYTKGASVLVITDEIDKARFGRELPLTTRARAALDSVCPAKGIIFGAHDYRHQLERAARLALPPELARTFSAYDLRHARATEWVESSGDIAGTAYLLGHKQVTTTNKYAHPSIRAGRKVLDAASGSPTRTGRGLVGDQILSVITPGAKKRGRTSTSFRTLEPESSVRTTLRDRAEDVIRDAAAQGPVDISALYDFARAALESTELGRLSLGVLDGGAFAPRRALELARLILLSATEEASAESIGEAE